MAAWSVVIGTVILVGIVVVVLARQGSPGRLSEHHGARARRSNVVDRPAGPGAESMQVSWPAAEPGAPPDRDVLDIDRHNDAVSPSRPPAEGGRDEIDGQLARRFGTRKPRA